jgi:hypothetical protein
MKWRVVFNRKPTALKAGQVGRQIAVEVTGPRTRAEAVVAAYDKLHSWGRDMRPFVPLPAERK